MKRLPLWWPPLLLLLAPCAGLASTHRDLTGYFGPMRAWTWARVRAGEVPWLNPGNGGFEAWFANPQTGLLYPPHWLGMVLPPEWALTAEIALHLAWLALGAGLLARALGGDGWGRSITEAAAWSCGPVIASVGVLNNLEALAWLPWVVLAARLERPRRAAAAVALTAAACWLTGEPVVFGAAALLAVVASRRRTATLAGFALAGAVVAVQVLPFLAWVREGSRAAELAVRPLPGALAPAGWLGLLAPVVPAGTGGLAWLESLFVGAPLLVLILLGGRRHPVWLAVAGGLGVLATLPAVGLGGIFVDLTAGLVRYPSRFALLAVVAALPLIGPGTVRWRAGEGRTTALWVAAASGVSAILSGSLAIAALALTPVLPLVAAAVWPGPGSPRDAAVVCGLAVLVAVGLPSLLDQSGRSADFPPPWREARADGRLWTPPVDPARLARLGERPGGARLWPVGYLNLVDGISLARSFAPIEQRDLEVHLDHADQGPTARWWIDTLGARWIVLDEADPHPRDWVAVRRRDHVVLYRNPRAIPLATVAQAPPEPDRAWRGVGAVVTIACRTDRIAVVARLPRSGVLWLDLAPLAGWRWSLDGRPATLHHGPGVLQWLPLDSGTHRLVGHYRPPGLVAGVIISMLGLVATVLLATVARAESLAGAGGRT